MNLPLNTDLTGKVAVVTGAGGVLCAMFSRALAQSGAKVADAVDQKRADHTHQGQNQNDHDHDQLRAQRPHRLALLSIFQMRGSAALRRKVIARAALG